MKISTGVLLRQIVLESMYLDGEDIVVSLYPSLVEHPDWGRVYLDYTIGHEGNIVLQGDQFSPAPGLPLVGDVAVGHLLSFFYDHPDEMDDERRAEFSQEQLAWLAEHSEELAFWAESLEEKGDRQEIS